MRDLQQSGLEPPGKTTGPVVIHPLGTGYLTHISDGPIAHAGFGLHDSDGRALPLTGIPAQCPAAELFAVIVTIVHDRPRRRRGAIVRRTKTIEVPVPLGSGPVSLIGTIGPGVAAGLTVPAVDTASRARIVAALHGQFLRLELRRPPALRKQPDPGRGR